MEVTNLQILVDSKSILEGFRVGRGVQVLAGALMANVELERGHAVAARQPEQQRQRWQQRWRQQRWGDGGGLPQTLRVRGVVVGTGRRDRNRRRPKSSLVGSRGDGRAAPAQARAPGIDAAPSTLCGLPRRLRRVAARALRRAPQGDVS